MGGRDPEHVPGENLLHEDLVDGDRGGAGGGTPGNHAGGLCCHLHLLPLPESWLVQLYDDFDFMTFYDDFDIHSLMI